jgi:UPF0755 protein
MFGKRSDETRTPEDRARAAAERAARRAGRPLPQEAFDHAVPPPDMQDFHRPEPPPPPPPPPPPEEPPPPPLVEQHTVEYTPFQTGEHAVPEPAGEQPRVRRIPRSDPRVQRQGEDRVSPVPEPAASYEPAEPEPAASYEPVEPEPTGSYERAEPEPTSSPVAVSDRPLPPRRPAPPTPRRRPASPPPAGPRRTGAGYWGRRIFGVIALLVILAVLYAINATFQPFHGGGSGSVAVVVPERTDVGGIAKLLHEKGVISSPRFFEVNATVTGRRGNLHPGRYTLAKGMSNGDALDALTKGPKAAKVVPTFTVRFTEGPSRKEMAPLVDKKVEGSYLKATSSDAAIRRIRKLGAPKGTKTAEGFLFPATYTLQSGADSDELVKQQLDAFAENFRHVNMSYAKSKHLTRYDVLIIASMIEREAQLPRERALVSAVIYNRLKDGMPLGIDATIRYSTNNWSRPIRQSELDKDEPYNTRLHRGLPPTPIGNPGLASLKAAAKPAKKSYLYYVRKPGKSGEHAFSSSDAQFEKDVAKYQDSRGGK